MDSDAVECHYAVLDVSRSASQDEIRRAYRKQALLHHPDRNIERHDEATHRFKLIQQAFDTLSEPSERAWYDSHRNEILTKHLQQPQGAESTLNIASYINVQCFNHQFNDDGPEANYYSVYNSLFNQIEQIEISALQQREVARQQTRSGNASDEEYDSTEDDSTVRRPAFGTSHSPISVVQAFYSYYASFRSHRTFRWRQKFEPQPTDSRQIRRAMHRENKRERQRAKQHYVDEIRSLVQFVKRLDPRLKAHDAKQAAAEREAEAERAAQKKIEDAARREARAAHAEIEAQRLEQQEADRKAAYGNIDAIDAKLERKEMKRKQKLAVKQQKKQQSKVEESSSDSSSESEHSDASHSDKADAYQCELCNKLFSSEAQLSNHAASKKHRTALREQQRQAQRSQRKAKSPQPELDDEKHHEAHQGDCYCVACEAQFLSLADLSIHNDCASHKQRVAKLKQQLQSEEQTAKKLSAQQQTRKSVSFAVESEDGSSDSESESESDSSSDDSVVQSLARSRQKRSAKQRKKLNQSKAAVQKSSATVAAPISQANADLEAALTTSSGESIQKKPKNKAAARRAAESAKQALQSAKPKSSAAAAESKSESESDSEVDLTALAPRQAHPSDDAASDQDQQSDVRAPNAKPSDVASAADATAAAEVVVKSVKLNGKQRKAMRQGKAADLQLHHGPTTSSNECSACHVDFGSRTKLFNHLKATPSHAKPL